MPQHKNKDRTKNQYQVGIVLAIIAMLLYGYALYNAVRIHKKSSIYIDGAIMTAWFLLALYWLRQLGLHAKKQQQDKDKDNLNISAKD